MKFRTISELAGHKPRETEEKRVNLRMDAPTWDRLCAYARKHNTTCSEVIRCLVAAHVASEASG